MKITIICILTVALIVLLYGHSSAPSPDAELLALKQEVTSLRNEITKITSVIDTMKSNLAEMEGRFTDGEETPPDSKEKKSFVTGLTNEANLANVAKSVKTGEVNMESHAISLDKNSAWSGLFLNLLGKPNAPVVIGDGEGQGRIFLHPNSESYFHDGLNIRQKGAVIHFAENAPLKVSSFTSGISALFGYQTSDPNQPEISIAQHLAFVLDPVQNLAKFFSTGSRSGGFYFGVNDQKEYMRIAPETGNVGINNINPQEKLEISGNVKVSDNLMVGNAISTGSIIARSNMNSGSINTVTLNSKNLNNSGNIINNNGTIKSNSITANHLNVDQFLVLNSRRINPFQINTYREHTFLHVDRESDTNNGHQVLDLRLADHDAIFAFGGIDEKKQPYAGGFIFDSNGNRLLNINPPSNKVRLQVHGGDFEITGSIRARGTINSIRTTVNSDLRYKTDIEPIKTAFKKIEGLKPKSYKSKIGLDEDFADETQFGFIAQEVEKVLPNLVHTNDEGDKSVDYIGLIPLLVDAIKEQQKKIEELEKKF